MRGTANRFVSAFGVLVTAAGVACGGSSGSSTPETPASGTPPATATGAFFPPAAIWYADVSQAPLDRDSAAVTAYLDRVGWGTGRMQIDFSIEVLEASGQHAPHALRAHR